jgi:hypothetical protein
LQVTICLIKGVCSYSTTMAHKLKPLTPAITLSSILLLLLYCSSFLRDNQYATTSPICEGGRTLIQDSDNPIGRRESTDRIQSTSKPISLHRRELTDVSKTNVEESNCYLQKILSDGRYKVEDFCPSDRYPTAIWQSFGNKAFRIGCEFPAIIKLTFPSES